MYKGHGAGEITWNIPQMRQEEHSVTEMEDGAKGDQARRRGPGRALSGMFRFVVCKDQFS